MVKSYDLSLVLCTLGPIKLSGYGESDAISLEPVEDLAVVKYSADGQATVERSNNKGWRGTLTLMSTSLAYKLLGASLQLQAGVPVYVPLPFFLSDPTNGDLIFSAYTIFTKKPAIAKNKGVSQVVFGIELPKADVSFGAAILL